MHLGLIFGNPWLGFRMPFLLFSMGGTGSVPAPINSFSFGHVLGHLYFLCFLHPCWDLFDTELIYAIQGPKEISIILSKEARSFFVCVFLVWQRAAPQSAEQKQSQ